jgi:7-alpha-hydroxysteroid dehydrogenase
MCAYRRGTIVNVSSAAARHPEGATLVYAMAKAGLECLTAGLVAAYGPTVRANIVVPGPTATDMLSLWQEDDDPGRTIRRVGHPLDFVGTCVFLASDTSLHVSGSSLTVN